MRPTREPYVSKYDGFDMSKCQASERFKTKQGRSFTCRAAGLQQSLTVRIYTLHPSKPWSCHAGADAFVSKAWSAWGVMELSSSGSGWQSLYRMSIAGSITARPLEGLCDLMNGGYAPPTASSRHSPSRVLKMNSQRQVSQPHFIGQGWATVVTKRCRQKRLYPMVLKRGEASSRFTHMFPAT